MELWQEIMDEQRLLDRAVRELKPRGQARAQAEHDYRVALSKRLLILRAEGNAVTHLAEIAKGEPEIADLRLQMDIAERLYQAALESSNVEKRKIRILEGQLCREWGNTK